jgi:tight adherence protein B
MDDLAVLAIPAVLVAGLVLVGLGTDGRAGASGPRRWAGRFQDWATQAGVRGARLWQVVAVCGGAGVAVGMAVLVLTRSLWLGLAFAGLAGWLPLGALRARRRHRLRELREVWPDAIDNLGSGVRAGMSLPEAVAGWPSAGRRRCERRSRALPTTTTPTAASAPLWTG